MKTWVLLATGLAACQLGSETPSMPWLYGLSDVVASDRASDELGRRMADWSDRNDYDPRCPPGSAPAIELVADLAPTPGRERIWVSLAHGIAVFDAEGRLVTETPGYACDGSADELEAIAVGDAFGAPMLAIAATSGGHRQSSTWISLLRVGEDRTLDATFTGSVVERDGTSIEQGAIVLLPNALIYRHPRAKKPTLWIYNPVARAYLVPGDPIDESHDEGPSAVSSR
jgi:hypothetical protein